MIVKYKTTVSKSRDNEQDIFHYDLIESSCCKKSIEFDSFLEFHGTVRGGFIGMRIKDQYGGYDDSYTNYAEIEFCPFCGTKIVCIEAERVRRIEKVIQVSKIVNETSYEFVPEQAR